MKRRAVGPSRKPGSLNAGKLDKTLLWLSILLTFIGILAVFNASAPQALAVFGDSYHFARQQIIWSFLGIVALVVTSNIHYTYWKKVAFLGGIIAVFLLLLVLVPGIGAKVLGARRWISVGPMSLQPSEFAKFAVAVVMAKVIDEKYPYQYGLFFIAFMCGLIMLQPDLGTTMVIAAIGLAQMFVGGIALGTLLAAGSGAALVAGLLVLASEYRRARLMTFFESSVDPLGSSYHMRQILIALGSGGIFGVGLGQSRQKYLFLPEAATDSVFAIIAEETGFVGATIVITLLTVFMLRMFKIAKNAPDNFSKLLASGISFWLAIQMLLNLSSVVAVTPITGIPLPFFSYGGSSLLMILFSTGIILNISKHAKTQ